MARNGLENGVARAQTLVYNNIMSTRRDIGEYSLLAGCFINLTWGATMRRKVAFRGKRHNRLGIFLVAAVLVMLLVVISMGSMSLKQRQNEYRAREAELDELIAAEENRTKELEEFKRYTQTQAYIEKLATDKLGLVHEGEIVFKMN